LAAALKYSPLPSAAVKEFTDAMAPPQIPPELQQMIQEGQQLIQQLQQQVQQMQADKSVETGKLQLQAQDQQIDAFRAQTERESAQVDGAVKVAQTINGGSNAN
jgi:hypothetical protein